MYCGSPASRARGSRRCPCPSPSGSAAGHRVEILDGDEVRTNLSKGLGFSKEDRDTNIRRIGFVAELLARNGVVAITAAISPYREVRDEVRAKITRHGAGFVEVYVECPHRGAGRARREGPLQEGARRRDQELHRRLRPYEAPLEARGDGATATARASRTASRRSSPRSSGWATSARHAWQSRRMFEAAALAEKSPRSRAPPRRSSPGRSPSTRRASPSRPRSASRAARWSTWR